MAILIKGDRVSFLRTDGGDEIVLPPRHVIAHDVLGEVVRGCDFYMVPFVFEREGMSASDLEMRREAYEYYGSFDDLCEVKVVLPSEGWKHLADVRAIRYRRVGYLGDLYEHEYAEPQPLYRNRKHGAYLIVSPDHCVANARGFVAP